MHIAVCTAAKRLLSAKIFSMGRVNNFSTAETHVKGMMVFLSEQHSHTTQSYLKETHTDAPLKTSKFVCVKHADLHIHTSPSLVGESKNCR
jgi:hypothetical protein